MKALSLGLIKGIIDGIDEQFNVSWVKPRLIDLRRLVNKIINNKVLKSLIGRTVFFISSNIMALWLFSIIYV